MSAPTKLSKLNHTTITVPTSNSTTDTTLKLSCSPYLSIQHPDLSTIKTARRNGDSFFEVIVPVGGKVEVDIQVEGVELMMPELGNGMNEFELEELVREEMGLAFERNRSILDLDQILISSPTTLSLQPLASGASRAAIIGTIIPNGTPIAHLSKIDITVAWTTSNIAFSHQQESQASASAETTESGGNSSEFFLSDEEDDPQPEVMAIDRVEDGPIPSWAKDQLHTSLGKLFRGELIKRFPLIFDAEFALYLQRITPPAGLSTTLNRCLHLSRTYSTPLLDDMRVVFQSISISQKRLIDYRQHQVTSLKRLKRRKTDPAESQESSSGGSQNTDGSGSNNIEGILDSKEVLFAPEETAHERLGDILNHNLVKMGRERWKSLRAQGRGRLSYNRIKLYEDHDTPRKDASVYAPESLAIGPEGFANETLYTEGIAGYSHLASPTQPRSTSSMYRRADQFDILDDSDTDDDLFNDDNDPNLDTGDLLDSDDDIFDEDDELVDELQPHLGTDHQSSYPSALGHTRSEPSINDSTPHTHIDDIDDIESDDDFTMFCIPTASLIPQDIATILHLDSQHCPPRHPDLETIHQHQHPPVYPGHCDNDLEISSTLYSHPPFSVIKEPFIPSAVHTDADWDIDSDDEPNEIALESGNDSYASPQADSWVSGAREPESIAVAGLDVDETYHQMSSLALTPYIDQHLKGPDNIWSVDKDDDRFLSDSDDDL